MPGCLEPRIGLDITYSDCTSGAQSIPPVREHFLARISFRGATELIARKGIQQLEGQTKVEKQSSTEVHLIPQRRRRLVSAGKKKSKQGV
jgi:hypothetical protein